MLSGVKVGKKKIKNDESKPQLPTLSNQSAAEYIRSQITINAGKDTTFSLDRREASTHRSSHTISTTNETKYTKRKAVDISGISIEKHGQDLSIQDMVRAEKSDRRSMDDIYAQTILRMGSRKYPTSTLTNNSKSHGDDHEDKIDDIVNLTTKKMADYSNQGKDALFKSRRIPTNVPMMLASKSWWWIESPSFSKHMLLTMGDHISMVMAPAHQSLFPGECVYLVPIAPTDALVQCDDDVWTEIKKFQSSLRKLYAYENKDVIFTETVMPTNKSGRLNYHWQARYVAIPIPRKANAETPIYFRQALLDQSQDTWQMDSTSSKIMSTKGTRRGGLRSMIPLHFPYFHVEWEPNEGYVQILESNHFPRDFAMDTLAGMLGMDTIRLRRNRHDFHSTKTNSSIPEEQQQMVKTFLEKWKQLDRTLDHKDKL
jgi:hypothetical protein